MTLERRTKRTQLDKLKTPRESRVADESIDVIITDPPYPNVLDNLNSVALPDHTELPQVIHERAA